MLSGRPCTGLCARLPILAEASAMCASQTAGTVELFQAAHLDRRKLVVERVLVRAPLRRRCDCTSDRHACTIQFLERSIVAFEQVDVTLARSHGVAGVIAA